MSRRFVGLPGGKARILLDSKELKKNDGEVYFTVDPEQGPYIDRVLARGTTAQSDGKHLVRVEKK